MCGAQAWVLTTVLRIFLAFSTPCCVASQCREPIRALSTVWGEGNLTSSFFPHILHSARPSPHYLWARELFSPPPFSKVFYKFLQSLRGP